MGWARFRLQFYPKTTPMSYPKVKKILPLKTNSFGRNCKANFSASTRCFLANFKLLYTYDVYLMPVSRNLSASSTNSKSYCRAGACPHPTHNISCIFYHFRMGMGHCDLSFRRQLQFHWTSAPYTWLYVHPP